MEIIRLYAFDDYGRARAAAVFKQTSRANPVSGKRDRGFRLLAADGVDFGDQRFWFDLPKGATGVVAGNYPWQIVEILPA